MCGRQSCVGGCTWRCDRAASYHEIGNGLSVRGRTRIAARKVADTHHEICTVVVPSRTTSFTDADKNDEYNQVPWVLALGGASDLIGKSFTRMSGISIAMLFQPFDDAVNSSSVRKKHDVSIPSPCLPQCTPGTMLANVAITPFTAPTFPTQQSKTRGRRAPMLEKIAMSFLRAPAGRGVTNRSRFVPDNIDLFRDVCASPVRVALALETLLCSS